MTDHKADASFIILRFGSIKKAYHFWPSNENVSYYEEYGYTANDKEVLDRFFNNMHIDAKIDIVCDTFKPEKYYA